MEKFIQQNRLSYVFFSNKLNIKDNMMKAALSNNRWLEVANRLYELKKKKHEAAIKAIVARLSIPEKYELATFLSFLYQWEFASFLSEDNIRKQYHL